MAEFVLKDMVERRGLEDKFHIASAATSTEEIGNPVHCGTRDKLKHYGITVDGKYAVQLRKKDYEEYDYLIGMDQRNIMNMIRIAGSDPMNKICRLLDYTEKPGDIADPWYTGDFDSTYEDVVKGCEAFLKYVVYKET